MYSCIPSYHLHSKSLCTFLNSGYSDADKNGPAVYTARAILRGMDTQRQEYRNECEMVYTYSTSSRLQNEEEMNTSMDLTRHQFSITPNPAKEIITVHHYGNFKSLSIQEIDGKVVFEMPINTHVDSENFDISTLSNGIYILKMVNDSDVHHIKLVINK